MANEWPEYRLGEVTQWSSGGTPSKSKDVYWNGDIPWISASSMYGNRFNDSKLRITEGGLRAGSRLAPKDSILLLVRGSMLHQKIPVGIAERDVAFNQDVKALKVSVSLDDPWFLLFWFMSKESELLSMVENTGIGAGKLDTKLLQNMLIRIPPENERRRIVTFIKALDDKIELNRKMNETLEAMAQALFKSWFVDFDPVIDNALAAGNPIPEELSEKAERRKKALANPEFPTIGKKGSNVRKTSASAEALAKAGFPDSFQPSELGPIPSGWHAKLLSELCTLGRGASPRPINDYMNGEVPWIKIADATAAGGPFLFETKEKVKTAGAEKSVAVSPGDLILSNSATCGVPMFVELHGCIHDGWLYFKNLREISKIYLFHVLIELAEHLIYIADGSVQKNLNTSLVGQQNVVVPPKAIVDSFDAHATVWFAKMRQNCLESRTLATLRDTLLPKLLSGELRIQEAEKMAEGGL